MGTTAAVMKGKKEKCDDGGEIQGLGQVWKQPTRKVWRSSRSFVEECSHKVSSAARPKSERTVSQRPTEERMERAQLVALLLPKRFMICALNLLLIVLPGTGAAVGTYLPCIGVLIRYRPAPKSPKSKSPFGPRSSPLSRIRAGGANWTSTSQLPFPGT